MRKEKRIFIVIIFIVINIFYPNDDAQDVTMGVPNSVV